MCHSCCFIWVRLFLGLTVELTFGISKYWRIANILITQHNSGHCHNSWVAVLPWLFSTYFTKLLISPSHYLTLFSLVLPEGRRSTAVSGDLALEEDYGGTRPGAITVTLAVNFSRNAGGFPKAWAVVVVLFFELLFLLYQKYIPAPLGRSKHTHF